MTAWYEMRELEAYVNAANARGPDIALLLDCANAIAAATKRTVDVKLTENSVRPMLIYQYRQHDKDPRTSGSVRIEDGQYIVARMRTNDAYDAPMTSTEELAWELCGFPFLPSRAREVRNGLKAEDRWREFDLKRLRLSETDWSP